MVEKVRAHAEREVALVSVVLTTHHSETIFSFYTSFGNDGKSAYRSFGNHGKKLPSFFQEMKH